MNKAGGTRDLVVIGGEAVGFQVDSKSLHKDDFVTSGGASLDDILSGRISGNKSGLVFRPKER